MSAEAYLVLYWANIEPQAMLAPRKLTSTPSSHNLDASKWQSYQSFGPKAPRPAINDESLLSINFCIFLSKAAFLSEQMDSSKY